MATTDIGEVVNPPRSIIITNSAGAAVDADALPTWAVTLPDGTAGTPPTVQHGGTGEYFVNYVATMAGRHEDVWTATVGGLVAKFGPDSFHVRAATAGPVVALAEARTWFGLNDTDPSRDETIRDILDSATEDVERITGRTVRRQTITDTFDGGKTGVALRSTPVISVTTVVDSGGTIPAGSYTVDTNSGIVYRGSSLAPIPFIVGRQNVAITYVAGMPVVPARWRDAIREIARERYDLQRGGSGQPRQQAGGALSGRALAEKLLEHDKAPGF